MDLNKVTSVVELKAFAYDIMRERDRLRENLDLIMQRIAQIEQQPKEQPVEQKSAK